MHEMAIAQGIMNIALTAARENGAAKITAVKVVVGQMTGVDPDSLAFCFKALAKTQENIDAAEAELILEIVPLLAECQNCQSGIEFKNNSYRFLCPSCGSPEISIISGKELKVEHVDIE